MASSSTTTATATAANGKVPFKTQRAVSLKSSSARKRWQRASSREAAAVLASTAANNSLDGLLARTAYLLGEGVDAIDIAEALLDKVQMAAAVQQQDQTQQRSCDDLFSNDLDGSDPTGLHVQRSPMTPKPMDNRPSNWHVLRFAPADVGLELHSTSSTSIEYERRRRPLPLPALLQSVPLLRGEGTTTAKLITMIAEARSIALADKARGAFEPQESSDVALVMLFHPINLKNADYSDAHGIEYTRRRRPMITDALLSQGFTIERVDLITKAMRSLQPLLLCCHQPFRAFQALWPPEIVIQVFMAVVGCEISREDLLLILRTVAIPDPKSRWAGFRANVARGNRAADKHLEFLDHLARRHAMDLVDNLDSALATVCFTSAPERAILRDKIVAAIQCHGLSLRQTVPEMKRALHSMSGICDKTALTSVTCAVCHLLDSDRDLVLASLTAQR